ncbi:MAG: ribonuclease T2 [Hyphomicrobium sp.]
MNRRLWGFIYLLACAGIVVSTFAAGPALAQRNDTQTSRDDDGNKSSYEERRNRGKQPEFRRNTAGDFDYYALVLSWSPTHCASEAGADDDLQCNRQDGRRYSFIVHGLWPQYERGYPENCMRAGSSYIPEQIIDRMLDIMPSKKLIIHEYRKHGTCSGLAPFAYFEFLRREFAEIKIPERFVNPFESQFISPQDLADEFLSINPSLKPEMLAVSCGGAGNRLKEIHVCLSHSGQPVACGANENPKRLCNATKMFVPPVRSSRVGEETSDAPGKARQQRSPLPMPRIIPWDQ